MKSFIYLGCVIGAAMIFSVAGESTADQRVGAISEPQAVEFEAPDKPETMGKIDAKTSAANVTYGTASLPHGMYAMTPRPPCQFAAGWASNNYSVCTTVSVYIPISAHIDSIVAYARESGSASWVPCNYPQDCNIGWSAFYPAAQTSSGPVYQIVNWRFMNWSHNRARDGMVAVTWH
jgi:hypothetical protein